MADWIVATLGQGGRTALDALSDLGHNCWRPKYREKLVVRGQKVWQDRFLFGEYFLIEMRMRLNAFGAIVRDWASQFHEIVGVRGVRGVIAVDGSPVAMRDSAVQRMRAKETRGYLPAPSKQEFARNQRVFVETGVFADNYANYQFSSEKFDYVDFDGRFARVIQIPRGSIVAA